MSRRGRPPKKPKNIRFRQDQIEALAKMETAEDDFSSLVRRAVDMFIQKLPPETDAKGQQDQPDGDGNHRIGFSKKFSFLGRRSAGPQ